MKFQIAILFSKKNTLSNIKKKNSGNSGTRLPEYFAGYTRNYNFARVPGGNPGSSTRLYRYVLNYANGKGLKENNNTYNSNDNNSNNNNNNNNNNNIENRIKHFTGTTLWDIHHILTHNSNANTNTNTTNNNNDKKSDDSNPNQVIVIDLSKLHGNDLFFDAYAFVKILLNTIVNPNPKYIIIRSSELHNRASTFTSYDNFIGQQLKKSSNQQQYKYNKKTNNRVQVICVPGVELYRYIYI